MTTAVAGAVLFLLGTILHPARDLSLGGALFVLPGLLIFVAGPRSPFVQVLEVIGVGLYAAGFALLARTRLAAPGSGRAS